MHRRRWRARREAREVDLRWWAALAEFCFAKPSHPPGDDLKDDRLGILRTCGLGKPRGGAQMVQSLALFSITAWLGTILRGCRGPEIRSARSGLSFLRGPCRRGGRRGWSATSRPEMPCDRDRGTRPCIRV